MARPAWQSAVTSSGLSASPAILALLTTFIVSCIIFTLLALSFSRLHTRASRSLLVQQQHSAKRCDEAPDALGWKSVSESPIHGTENCVPDQNHDLNLNHNLTPLTTLDATITPPLPLYDEQDPFHYQSSATMANGNQNQPLPANVLRPKTRPPTPTAGPAPTIHLARLNRRYTGVRLAAGLPHPVEAWRGIPYAQSTAGANRFRPPVPLEPYDAGEAVVEQATAFGPVCPGSTGRLPAGAEGEDCLNLNVYRPANVDTGPLPVVVYVHGGAFNGGMGVERDMASFIAWAAAGQGTPLVGVNFNYRVGALGFPSSRAADAEGCLNLGLKDQRMLFEWVRENIGAFGGDCGRVTVMGLSAGAHSIGYHLQAYTDPSTAPFHAAILESGGATARATFSPSHPRTETQWRQFLEATGLSSSSSPAGLFDRLRASPLDAILRASSTVFGAYQDPIRWPFQPVIESNSNSGAIITDLPIIRFRTGAFLHVPILTGFNTHEGAVFCSPRVDTNADFLAKFTALIPGLASSNNNNNNADIDSLCTVYPDPNTTPKHPYGPVPRGFGRQWSRYERAYAHYAYICPALQTAHFHTQHGVPAWAYHFAARAHPEFGGTTNHGDEAVVVAREERAIGEFPGLWAASEAMHGAWVRFIASGDPNGRGHPSSGEKLGAPFWPRFESPRAEVMMFGGGNDERMGGAGRGARGTPARVAALTEKELEECQFWWGRVELSEGMGKKMDIKARL